MLNRSSFTGVILAGGNSTRFGKSKAELVIAGKPVVEHLATLLATRCEGILVSVRSLPDVPCSVGDYVVDRVPGQGPLSGIHAGLQAARLEWCLVVACDMPYLNPDLVSLLSLSLSQKTRAVVCSIDGFVYPFPGLYSKAILPDVEKALHERRLSVWQLLKKVRATIISSGKVRAVDPNLDSFVNVNEPRDLLARRVDHRGLAAGQISR